MMAIGDASAGTIPFALAESYETLFSGDCAVICSRKIRAQAIDVADRHQSNLADSKNGFAPSSDNSVTRPLPKVELNEYTVNS
jgi:hypothetical protein